MCYCALEPVPPKRPWETQNSTPDDALGCPNGHYTCLNCVRKLVKPTVSCCRKCTGLKYCCPICRVNSCLEKKHVLTLLLGSWDAMFDTHHCDLGEVEWNEGIVRADTHDGWYETGA